MQMGLRCVRCGEADSQAEWGEGGAVTLVVAWRCRHPRDSRLPACRGPPLLRLLRLPGHLPPVQHSSWRAESRLCIRARGVCDSKRWPHPG